MIKRRRRLAGLAASAIGAQLESQFFRRIDDSIFPMGLFGASAVYVYLWLSCSGWSRKARMNKEEN
jgi:hypothetical protein